MTTAIIAFACGIGWLQWQAALPTTNILLALAALGGLLFASAALFQRLRARVLIAAFLFGFVWAASLAATRLSDALPLASEGRDIDVVGVVAEMPQLMDRGLRFRFMVESASLQVPESISLAWYTRKSFDDDEPESVLVPIHAGERWRFRVRLKRPHGNLNPDGFDFESWLFERGVSDV